MLGWSRTALFLACLALLPLVLSAGEEKAVLILKTLSNPSMDARSEVFKSTLDELSREHGYALQVTELDMRNDRALGQELLKAALKAEQPDLVVPIATNATRVAWQQSLETPGLETDTFFFFVSDPVGMGIVPEIGQTTGKQFSGYVNVMDRTTKVNLVLSMLNQVKRETHRILLIHTSYPASSLDAKLLLEIADARSDLEFIPVELSFNRERSVDEYMSELATLIDQTGAEFDYIWVGLGPLGRNEDYLRAIQSTYDQTVVCSSDENSVAEGALFTITSNAAIDGRAAANRADRILRGESVSAMPVERTPRFLTAVNIDTATQLGIVVPPNILRLSEGHVYP